MPVYRIAFAVVALAAAASSAQGAAAQEREGVEDELSPGISAYNSGNYESAVVSFYKVSESGNDALNRQKAEYYLGQSYLKMKLYQPAMGQFLSIFRAGSKHRYYFKSIDGLISVAEALGDFEAIPSQLDKAYGPAFEKLPDATLNKVNFLLGALDFLHNKVTEAQDFLSSIPKTSSYYARARYLYGLTLVQKQPKELVKIFKEVMKLGASDKQFDLENVQQLTRLALARTYYGMQEYDKSVKYYDQVPRFSDYWDVALFENGWAAFQNADPGKAMGSLQALHAPQFAGAFAPESWILKATIYFFACLYPEAKGAVAGFRRIYLPMAKQITATLEGDHDFEYYANLVSPGNREMPSAVVNYLLSNKHLAYYQNYRHELASEKSRVSGIGNWKEAGLSNELLQEMDSQSQNVVKWEGRFIQKRLKEATKTIEGFDSNAEIILFETLKAEKELIEKGTDADARLREQHLYRAQVPDPSWDYWRFEGEFWIDEIGYYTYTLKNACVLRGAKPGSGAQASRAGGRGDSSAGTLSEAQ